MTRRILSLISSATLVAAVIAVPAIRLSAAADGSITGTITATGQTSNGNTVVYIEKAAGTFAPKGAQIDQHSLTFEPHVVPLLVGSTLTFLNTDTVPHNVFSPSYEKYNLGTWKPGEKKTYTFKTCKKFPCVYAQLCLLHQEMSAYAVVLQNPYFAVSDASGQYTIKDVPPGQYTLAVWHEGKLKAAPKTITVTAGKPLSEDFTLQP
ncbi:MAG: carboxypeptidase regulatory-like domain-containing protein [Acidobacteriota bacterium]|nr:carboxypeptidase regulatory-like domain-containing protein [Acidobacteriota bacterium]